MNAFINKIPENYQGKPLDLKETQQEDNLENAEKCYTRAKKRLLNPPIWHEIAGVLSADFKIENNGDDTTERLLKQGDFLRINIHSPDVLVASNYDWVQVAEIHEEVLSANERYFLVRLIVAGDPNNTNEKIDHFFKEGASSTFVIYQKENNITAYYYGRNEEANTDSENDTLENIRNKIIALGAMAGFSNLQWSRFLTALLEPEL